MATTVPANCSFAHFDCQNTEGISVRWNKYLARYKNMMKGFNITNPEQLLALLLHFGGEDLYDIFESLPEAEKASIPATEGNPAQDVFVRGCAVLSNYFTPKQNTEYQKYEFRRCLQLPSESLDKFVSRLKALAATCDFTDINAEVKSQVISGCISQRLRRKGLSEVTWDLPKLLEVGKVYELSDNTALDIERTTEKVNELRVDAVRSKAQSGHQSSCPSCKSSHPRGKCPAYGKECNNCGLTNHFAGTKKCPAMGKKCQSCGKQNHFARKCKSKTPPQMKQKKPMRKQIQMLEEQSEVPVVSRNEVVHEVCSNDFTWSISQNQSTMERPVFPVTLNGIKVEFLADSGASVNILSLKDYNKLQTKPSLEYHNKYVYAYGSDVPLDIRGKFMASLVSENATCFSPVIVSGESDKSLLSWDTSRKLRLIDTVRKVDTLSPQILKLKTEYKDIFTGLGKLKDVQVKLHVDKNIEPVVQNSRRTPFHVRNDIEKQLQLDEERGVIERPDGPTPWVSPIVVVPKKSPGQVRICVDMRAANRAIKRTNHSTPTLTEIIHELNGAKVFSKIDLNQGYNQLELDEESREITTFTSHVGLKRYTRLFFGINSAAEIFQEEIRKALCGLKGVFNVSDDILCFGKDASDHLANLKQLFQRIRERGLTLAAEKCKFEQSEIQFLGHTFSENGLSPCKDKIEALLNMAAPKNPSDIRSLLGMANFCGQRFIRNYATITHDLRVLTKKETPWEWTDKQQNSFDKLKKCLTSAPALAYYDPKLETEVYVDASPVGISAILMQKESNSEKRVNVHFASRALTPTEQRYSQIEREGLAVVWACEHLHIYLYGTEFKIFTDHRPLLSLFTRWQSKPSARLQGWSLRLQPYKFELCYKPGKNNPADYLSRHTSDSGTQSSREQRLAESIINYVSSTSAPKPVPVEVIRQHTTQDATLQAVMKALHSGNWHLYRNESGVDKQIFDRCHLLREELSANPDYDLLLRDTRIVIPSSLQQNVVDLAHMGHQGIVKTKALLREKVWFCNIDSFVEDAVKSCLTCQIATPSSNREPLRMSPLPRAPWTELSMDFGQVSPNQYLFVVMDEYSRFPFVEIVNSTSAQAVIPKLDSILTLRGIPDVVKSDNGPPFNGEIFHQYATSMGFKHRKITPLWPKANSEVERFMRTVKKVVKAGIAQNLNWKQELRNFLLAYRATPHSTTKVAPATLLFGSPIRSKLPEVKSYPDDQEIRTQDTLAKMKMKEYHDQKANVKTSTLKTGDNALIKKTGMGRLTAYDKDPVKIVKTKGSMITAQQGNRLVTRNSSFFKKTSFQPPVQNDLDDQDIVSDHELVTDTDKGNNNVPSTPAPRKTNTPSVRSTPVPIRKSTRVSKRPTRLIETI